MDIHKPYWTSESGRFFKRFHLSKPFLIRLRVIHILFWQYNLGYIDIGIPHKGNGMWSLLCLSFHPKKFRISNCIFN